jgi:hypothetical protein
MPSAQFDLKYLETAADLLEDYLLSKKLFWQLGADPPPGEPSFPSLTLAGVLLAQARTNARNLPSDLKTRLYKINLQIDTIRSKWRTAWENKAKQEFSARLKLWRNFLEDYRQDPDANADRYAYEVSRRVALDLLNKEIGELQRVDREMVSGLDQLLNAVLLPGDFVWEEEIAAGFPKSEYPYLYGILKS